MQKKGVAMPRRPAVGDVELNTASMLDMAFQLLTFFILTFRPPPLEGQLAMTLPPAQPIGCPVGPRDSSAATRDAGGVKNTETLTITITGHGGGIEAISVGDRSTRSLAELNRWLKEAIGGLGSPFHQIILRVGDDLPYGELLKVVEVCTQQRFASGEELKKIGFVAMSAEPRP